MIRSVPPPTPPALKMDMSHNCLLLEEKRLCCKEIGLFFFPLHSFGS